MSVNKYLKTTSDVEVVHLYTTMIGLVLVFVNRSIKNKLFYTSVGLRRDKKTPAIGDRIAIWLETLLIKRVKKTAIANELMEEKLVTNTKIESERVQVVPHRRRYRQVQPRA